MSLMMDAGYRYTSSCCKIITDEIKVIQLLKNQINEPRHDKTNIMGLRPAWIQTSLHNRAV
jgi:hypothetical protein